jgi:uncharacterized protein DUF5947
MNTSGYFPTPRRVFTAGRALRPSFEYCQLCSAPIHSNHRHMMAVDRRKIICTCDPCALRFQNVAGGRFQLIPSQARPLPDFQMTDAQWRAFALPIDLAFVFCNIAQKFTTVYPGPAGPIESAIHPASWETILAGNAELDDLKPNVEALLINRLGAAREYFIAPIDVCYELAALIRKNWRRFAGGPTVWQEIERLFARMGRQMTPTTPG